jgi:hypothetical protein
MKLKLLVAVDTTQFGSGQVQIFFDVEDDASGVSYVMFALSSPSSADLIEYDTYSSG